MSTFVGVWCGRGCMVLSHKYHVVAKNLNVDVATVWRVVKNFEEHGSVEKKHYTRNKFFQKLSPPLELTILHYVLYKILVSTCERFKNSSMKLPWQVRGYPIYYMSVPT